MKRKTNLFYTTGSDSNFIVFSNYTESLTGNFLSTNIKLFPSKFLCLYIPDLVREDLIKHLTANYENKLAYMRDYCVENDKNIEKTIKPLGMLLDALSEYGEYEINFIGQVTEQDYNGIYADTICVIDSTSANHGEIETQEVDNEYLIPYDSVKNYLYGWYKAIGNNNYESTCPVDYIAPTLLADKDGNPAICTLSKTVKVIKKDGVREGNDIKFNCIIPLYDVINIRHQQNLDQIQDLTEIDCIENHPYVTNVPLGMWFSDKDILLTRAGVRDYAPSWSLVLSSQFKPFPYSVSKVSEIDQSDRMDAFSTFAQILVRQNKMLDKLSTINTTISALGNRIANIEANLSSVGTSYNIDGIHKEMIDLRTNTSYILEGVHTKIGDLVDDMTDITKDVEKLQKRRIHKHHNN